MSTDRELLEMAAKAGEMLDKLEWWEGRFIHDTGSPYVIKEWNPLTDDGDALRLAVKLGIALTFIERARREGPFVNACHNTGRGLIDVFEDGDDEAATRRAIVRAAASIGRAMP
jgi:hypothetical protein